MATLSWGDDEDGVDDFFDFIFKRGSKMTDSNKSTSVYVPYSPSSYSNENSTVTNSSDCVGCWDADLYKGAANLNISVLNNGSRDYYDISKGGEDLNVIRYHGNDQDELYEVPVSIIVLLSLLYGGISVMALIGNMLVLWVVTISRRMRTVTNMFIANLALADIIIGLFAIPFQFQAALLQRWNLPDFMCAFCPFVQILSVNVSVFTLSAIAVDRYRAVLYPLSARASKRKANWVIVSIWSLSLLLALPTELDYKVIYIMDKEKMKPFCTNLGLSLTFRKFYTLGLVVIQYFFPLIIISGAYAHMATKLWGATAPGNKEESRDAVVLRNKKKVIKMLALVVLLFALCWCPLQMYNFLQTLIPTINEYQYINIIWFCFHWIAMFNSCCNPFIYAIYNEKFQREFRTRLWCLRMLCSRSSSDDNLNYSDASDFDRTKVRASYRFKNNLSVRYNHQSVYNNNTSMRLKRVTSTGSRQQNQCNGFIKPRQHRSASLLVNNKRNHHAHSPPSPIPNYSTPPNRLVSFDVTEGCDSNAPMTGFIGSNDHLEIVPTSPPVTALSTTQTAVITSNSILNGGSSSSNCLTVKTVTVVATEATCRL